ncbi:hypothetical protein [Sinorhizobium meliloti]|uniref:hypothetical protein n=1 Tax=Rhizobium meliloti TaxID=382 RepID=UPI0013E3F4B1|nr:hypothetical protein [Sinorhizobium meliloti]
MERKSGKISVGASETLAPSWGEGIDFMNDVGGVAVVFGGGNDREAAVAAWKMTMATIRVAAKLKAKA